MSGWCFPRPHDWQPIAVQPLLTLTVVRQQCARCRRQRTKKVDGVWSLETLRGGVRS